MWICLLVFCIYVLGYMSKSLGLSVFYKELEFFMFILFFGCFLVIILIRWNKE